MKTFDALATLALIKSSPVVDDVPLLYAKMFQKSEIIKEMAKAHGYVVTDLPLVDVDIFDLVGLPIVNPVHEYQARLNAVVNLPEGATILAWNGKD